MNTRSFARFRTDVFRLHREGAYDKALALVDHEAASFPEEASGVTYWRVCLLARRGDVDAAFRVLGRAIETGWWRAERASCSWLMQPCREKKGHKLSC